MFRQPTDSPRSCGGRIAFTLIELLVVVAVIGVLVGLLFPLMGLVRSKMDSAQCLSQLRQIGVAVGGYITDHNGMLPGPLSFEQPPTYTPGQSGSLPVLLESYLGTASSVAPDGTSRYSPIFECPAAARKLHDPTKPTYIVSYLASPEVGQCVWGDPSQNQKPLPVTALANWNDANTSGAPLTLSETWAIQDGDQGYVAAANMYAGPVADLLPTQAHGDHWNDLFFDFHAASRSALITIQSPNTPAPTPPP